MEERLQCAWRNCRSHLILAYDIFFVNTLSAYDYHLAIFVLHALQSYETTAVEVFDQTREQQSGWRHSCHRLLSPVPHIQYILGFRSIFRDLIIRQTVMVKQLRQKLRPILWQWKLRVWDQQHLLFVHLSIIYRLEWFFPFLAYNVPIERIEVLPGISMPPINGVRDYMDSHRVVLFHWYSFGPTKR